MVAVEEEEVMGDKSEDGHLFILALVIIFGSIIWEADTDFRSIAIGFTMRDQCRPRAGSQLARSPILWITSILHRLLPQESRSELNKAASQP